MTPPLLRVEDLTVAFGSGHEPVVGGVSFEVAPGECFAIVGESGSGKSVTARTLIGLAGAGAHVDATALDLHGKSVLGNRDRDWRRIRGREVGFVLQDALVSLDPLRTVGREIGETLRLHRYGSRTRRRERVLELLTAVGVPEPELRARQLPHELSGGQRQRALIASAIALDPPLLIADEPTTALDVTIQTQILELLAVMKDRGTGLILISHDLSVVSRLADRVAVMRNGLMVEQGPVADVLAAPSHPYTRALLDAIPAAHRKGTRLSAAALPPTHSIVVRPASDDVLLEAKNLVKRFRGPDGVERTAVNDVSFTIGVGETLGIVGESGSGKTTTARLALALLAPDEGTVQLVRPPVDGAPHRRGRRPRRAVPGQRRQTAARHTTARRRRARRGTPGSAATSAVRRATSARRHRQGTRARAIADRLRRTGVRTRRHHPGTSPRPAGRPAGAARAVLPVHLARPRRHPSRRRPGAGDARRPSRRIRHRRRDIRSAK
jgi:peptide/nickel transport system ATP-binding protein